MNHSILPEYLRYTPDASPFQDAVVQCGKVRFTVITPQLIRIETGHFTDAATLVVICRNFAPTTPIVDHTGSTWNINTGILTVDYDESLPLEAGLVIGRKGTAPFQWKYGQQAHFNLGGTTSTLDRINGACPLGDGVCARDGFAVIDDSSTPLITSNGWFAPRASCTDIYFFGYGHQYTAAVQDYQKLTGAPELLPAFALGNWWSRYFPYTEDSYLKLMDDFEHHDIPLSVGIVDMDWHLTDGDGRTYHDGWTGYTWNQHLFPDYRRFLTELKKRGIKTALNLHPADGIRAHEALYEAVATEMGIDPKSKHTVGFNCLDPQFLKTYFEKVLFPYEEDGVHFWWIDWQQGKDYRTFLKENHQPHELECIEPLWMNNHMHYLASKRSGLRGMVFSRFAGYGSQRYPIGFSGDTYITWESLNFQPYFTATASNIGYGWWSHDIGGHMGGIRDDELTVRWIQLGVFSPIFRLHSTSSVFLGREPWNYNKRAEIIICDFMRLRHRLFPYLYTMNRRSAFDLLPLIRPMYHTHPENQEAYTVPNQYWFGDSMIVAPITQKADDSDLGDVKVWFPEGTWTDAFTGVVYKGNQIIDVYRPQEQIPVFLKAGALIPLQVNAEKSRTLGRSSEVELLVAPGANNVFDLYEDDGVSCDYKNNHSCTTRISLDWTDQKVIITIHPVRGDSSLIPDKRSWKIQLRGSRPKCYATVNGCPTPVSYDATTNSSIVKVTDVAASAGVTIIFKHPEGLTHDNQDVRNRVIMLLTRAQVTQDMKSQLLQRFERCESRVMAGQPFILENMGADIHPRLGRMMYELMMQRK